MRLGTSLKLVRTGFIAPFGGSGFNPSDSGPNIVLSNTNKTQHKNSPTGYSAIRSLVKNTAGKLYFELKYNVASGSNFDLGISNSTASLTPSAVNTVGGQYAMYRINGQVWINNALGPSYSTYAAGDTIGVGVDFATGNIWFSKNGVWNGSPSAGTGAAGTLVTTGGLFAYVLNEAYGDTASISTHSAQQTYAPPTGFSSWD